MFANYIYFLNGKKCDFYLENEEYQTQAYGLADNRILPEQGIFLGCNAFWWTNSEISFQYKCFEFK